MIGERGALPYWSGSLGSTTTGVDQHRADAAGLAEGPHAVRALCDVAFTWVGLYWERYVHFDERHFLPTVEDLRGDVSVACQFLDWQAQVGFVDLARMMLDYGFADARIDQTSREWAA